MEAQKEKSQPSSLLKDRVSLSDERLSDVSVSSQPQRDSDVSDVRHRLAVKRNSQLNSISPTLHKVQFAAIEGDDYNDNDKPAVNGPLNAADSYSNNSSQQHLNNNNNNNDNSTEVDESGVFSSGRSPEKSPKSSSWRDKNGKRRRTLSEASYFSATSTMSAGSASSSSSSSSGSSSYSYYTAPDGGWGWVIVAASFLVNMIADGVTFSFGVLFVEFQNEFGESKAVTAGIVSLFHAVPLLSGPVASALTDRYGCRKMTILGSLLATAGFLLSSISNSIEMLYLTFGLMSGFGLSLCYVAAVVIVAYYFDRRRSFATGISVCGSGVGTFLFAPLTQYLVEKYDGWRGACVILAGLFLNMCVCGTLFRDLEVTKKQRQPQQLRRSLSNASSSAAVTASAGMPEVEELRSLLEKGDISILFSQQELNDCPRLSSSLVNLPTYITSEENSSKGIDSLPEDVIHALSRNKKARKLIAEMYPDSMIAQSLSNCCLGDEGNKADRTGDANASDVKGTGLKRKVSSLFKKKPVRSILKKPKDEKRRDDENSSVECLSNTAMATAGATSPTLKNKHSSHFHHPQTGKCMYLNHLRVRRQSLTYRGAMLNINRYRLRASSCPDIYRNSMTTIAQEEETASGILSKLSPVSYCCGWHKFINPSYAFFCLSNFILYAWYDVMYVYLVDYSEKDLGYSSHDATFLISIIGILNTLGEVIVGWLGDQKWNNINLLYAICMLACGTATAIVPFLSSYSALGAMAGIFGFAISANYSLTSPILVELVSLEQFSNAYGLLLLVQGVSNLVGPPFAGYLYDVTKRWHYSFGLSGLCIALSGLLLLVIPCFNRASQFCTKFQVDRAVACSQRQRRQEGSSLCCEAIDSNQNGSCNLGRNGKGDKLEVKIDIEKDDDAEEKETLFNGGNKRSDPVDIPKKTAATRIMV